jgi:hypothetical protein
MKRRTESIRRACGLRTEAVRHALARGVRHGQSYEVRDHLKLNEESFLAGAQAMADAITLEQSEQQLAELDETEAAENVITFPALLQRILSPVS